MGGYHGTSFVKITILKGCEFPSYNFTELELYPTERKAYTQAATIDFIDWSPDMYFSTNWRANTEKGVATVLGAQYNVSGEDNLLTLKLSGTDYPTEGEKMVLELFRKIPEDRQAEALDLLRVALRMQKKL